MTLDLPWNVIQGESLAVLRTLEAGLVDAVLTDPPYSSGGAFRGDRMADTTAKYVQTGIATVRPDFAPSREPGSDDGDEGAPPWLS